MTSSLQQIHRSSSRWSFKADAPEVDGISLQAAVALRSVLSMRNIGSTPDQHREVTLTDALHLVFSGEDTRDLGWTTGETSEQLFRAIWNESASSGTKSQEKRAEDATHGAIWRYHRHHELLLRLLRAPESMANFAGFQDVEPQIHIPEEATVATVIAEVRRHKLTRQC